MDLYGFYMGQEFEAYRYMGAHLDETGADFCTFAPAAVRVSLIGEFNNWQESPMERAYDGNFWKCRVDGALQGQMYKYRIYSGENTFTDHCDPYAFWAELRPGTASRLYASSGGIFTDDAYLKRRRDRDHEPMNIYEVQAGAWRTPDPHQPEWHYTYRELADLLVPYLTEAGYNYLELMPVTEFPCDESWGYQTTGFFAPTSRYGTPDDLRYLINSCHAAGIGVIMDMVAVHFASDFYALSRYDGTPLYEYPNSDIGNSEWGTNNFMLSRGEVRSFLQSCACYWIGEFHFDGIRVDAVSNLIYWQGNSARGENQSALQFLRTMNSGLRSRFPNVLLIAEDSSSYPGVTKAVSEGGLGFDYKWDLGWMNDTLSYMQQRPCDRRNMYHKLTFSIYYYYNEKYLLPLSHDEVVHGKATIVQKMNGSDLDVKFQQARILYTYMFTHPGKKLNFMGNELGGLWEWTEKKEIDWWLIKDRPIHARFNDFTRALNAVYAENPALWSLDYERDGFEWTDCAGEGKNAVYSYVRRGAGQTILCVFNFGDADETDYEVTFPERDIPAPYDREMQARCIFDTLWKPFGGPADETAKTAALTANTLTVCAPALSAQLYIIE